MRHLQIKKEEMKRQSNVVLLLGLLVLFQLTDCEIFRLGLGRINNNFVFGLVAGNLLAITIAIILSALLYWITPKTKTARVAFFVLLAGVLSNISDRISYGGVIDYIKIWFIPTFNLADIAIVVSIIIIGLELIKKSRK